MREGETGSEGEGGRDWEEGRNGWFWSRVFIVSVEVDRLARVGGGFWVVDGRLFVLQRKRHT